MIKAVDLWLASKQDADIEGVPLKPFPHPHNPRICLGYAAGQATVYPCEDQQKGQYVLKIPHKGMQVCSHAPERLPDLPIFRAGKERLVLGPQSLRQSPGFFYNRQLASDLGYAIRMPKLQGAPWKHHACELRECKLALSRVDRIDIARTVCSAVREMEKVGVAHRDLVLGNLIVNLKVRPIECFIIDMESMFDPSEPMPTNTTSGTEGYLPSFVHDGNGYADAKKTYCPKADRAFGFLIVEILCTYLGVKATGDGGMFDQRELIARKGPGLTIIREQIQSECPSILPLLDRLVNARSFDECPSPDEWDDCLSTLSTADPYRSYVAPSASQRQTNGPRRPALSWWKRILIGDAIEDIKPSSSTSRQSSQASAKTNSPAPKLQTAPEPARSADPSSAAPQCVIAINVNRKPITKARAAQEPVNVTIAINGQNQKGNGPVKKVHPIIQFHFSKKGST